MDLQERMAQAEVRLNNVERDIHDIRGDIKDAAREIRSLTTEIKLVTQELREAVKGAVASAKKPFDQLTWGMRILAGLGAIVLGIASLIGSTLGIISYFKHH